MGSNKLALVDSSINSRELNNLSEEEKQPELVQDNKSARLKEVTIINTTKQISKALNDVIEEIKEPASVEQPVQVQLPDNQPNEVLIPMRHVTSRSLVLEDDDQFDMDLTKLDSNEHNDIET